MWLNFCGAITQSRLHYEHNGQINVFFGKKGMEIKKENTRVEKERKTNGSNGRKVESNNKQKVRKRKKEIRIRREKEVNCKYRARVFFNVFLALC